MVMTRLGALIAERKRDGGLSYQNIADRTGGTLSKSRVQQLATGRIDNLPPTETLRALARALDLPWSVVRDAALESVGMREPIVAHELSDDEDISLIAAASREMTPELRQQLREIADGFLRMSRAARKRDEGRGGAG